MRIFVYAITEFVSRGRFSQGIKLENERIETPEHPQDNTITRSYKKCNDWSIDRIEIWYSSAVKRDHLRAATGYLAALIYHAAVARKTALLHEVVENRLPATLGILSRQDFMFALDILSQILRTLMAEPALAVSPALDEYEKLGLIRKIERLRDVEYNSLTWVSANEIRLWLSDLFLSLKHPVESALVFEEALSAAQRHQLSATALLQARLAILQRHGLSDAAEELTHLVYLAKAPCFAFALFAVQEISLSGNAEVGSYKSSTGAQPERGNLSASAHIGSYGNILLGDNAQVFGSVIDASGTQPFQPPEPPQLLGNSPIFAKSRPEKVEIRGLRVQAKNTLPAPTVSDYQLAQVPPVPASAVTVNWEDAQAPNMTTGDFAMSELGREWQRIQRSGRIRLWLTDDNILGAPPFTLGTHRRITGIPVDYQIWYNGTRDILVNSLCATIYAPNATVRLRGNTIFAGAILARKIICEGNICICFDEDLVGKQF